MASSLSQAFADTIAHGQVPATALLTLMQAWPRDAWRADVGNPSPVEAALRWRPASGRPFERDEQQAWATLVERMVIDHTQASPLLQQTWMLDVVHTGCNSLLALKVWGMIRPHAAQKLKDGVLARALELSWTPLVQAVLDHGTTIDLGQIRAEFNPFRRVRTVEAFEALIAAGFDPFQPAPRSEDSATLLRARATMDTADSGGFVGANDRAMIMRRLSELGEALPAQRRLDVVVRHGHRWTELQTELRALGAEAWDVRFDGGGTLLHHVVQHKPDWLINLFKWAGIRSAPDQFFSAIDDHGQHALLYRWFATTPVSKAGDPVQTETAWWTALRDLPATARWLAGIPTVALDQPFKALLDTAARLKKPVPSLVNACLWQHMTLLGGWTQGQAREALTNDPDVQRRYDAAVWDPALGDHPRRTNHTGVIERLFDWQQALPSNAWLANQYAMCALQSYSPGAAYDSAALLRNRLAQAFAAGASLDWVEDKLQRGWSTYKLGPSADPKQTWVHAKAREERRLFSGALQDQASPVADRRRPRL